MFLVYKHFLFQKLCTAEQKYSPSQSSVSILTITNGSSLSFILRQVSILKLLDSSKHKPLSSNNVKYINLSWLYLAQFSFLLKCCNSQQLFDSC